MLHYAFLTPDNGQSVTIASDREMLAVVDETQTDIGHRERDATREILRRRVRRIKRGSEIVSKRMGAIVGRVLETVLTAAVGNDNRKLANSLHSPRKVSE